MNARTVALITSAILLTTVALLAQSRSARTTDTRRNVPAAQPPEPIPPEPAPPTPAGKVTPPNQGYVSMPESAPAGSVAGAPIPADPLDRAYWEMYDRERPITLTGKVTRV